MPRARLDHKTRKPLGFAVPDGVTGKDAWDSARIEDKSTAPLPTAPSEERQKRTRADIVPCRCDCLCGNRGVGGVCWFCARGSHHKCSRSCREYQPDNSVRGSQYIPPRAACNGGNGRPVRGGRPSF